MKASLTMAAVILGVAGILGWQNQAKLSDARHLRTRLEEQARAFGLDPAALLKGETSPRRLKSLRESAGDKAAVAKDFARELAAFAKEMKELQESGGEPDEGMRERIVGMIGTMIGLDVSQLKVLVAELREMPDVDEEMRRGIIGFAIMSMAEEHPAAALALLTESSDSFGKEGPGQHVVSAALAKWAEDDPMAAVEWIRKNAETHPEFVTEESKQGVLKGAAMQDPRLAFQLAGDLGLKNPGDAGRSIGGAAKTPGERTAVLAALRGHLAAAGTDATANEGLLKSTMAGIGEGLVQEGYSASSPWLESAGLTKAESSAIAEGLNWWQTKADTGKWIDWMSDKLPADQLDRKVGDLVGNWTKQDYKAAGEWINASEDGPAREAAARTYAVTVAPYEPASAAQWAETLPAGKDRDEAFKTIRSEWEKTDKEAAAEFARKHGMDP